MKTSGALHVEWVEGEAVALNPASGELHYLNSQAAIVFALIEELGFDPALERLRHTYGEHPDFESDLHELLEDMKDKGLLVDG